MSSDLTTNLLHETLADVDPVISTDGDARPIGAEVGGIHIS